MRLSVVNPNFTVVLPVGCNGKCKFCYWKPNDGLTYDRFVEVINSLPKSFDQISITGGEPTIMEDLSKWIKAANKRFSKVVLNTNGYKLTDDIAMSVDHVNLSRHQYDEVANRKVFGTTSVPDTKRIHELCDKADVTLNCWLPDQCGDFNFVANFIRYANHVGAKVAFRKDFQNLDLLPMDKNDTLVDQHSCGACRHRYHRIAGADVTFKYSVKETFDKMNGIYELILQGDGRLTYDWAGERALHNVNGTWTIDGKTDALIYEDLDSILSDDWMTIDVDDIAKKTSFPTEFKDLRRLTKEQLEEGLKELEKDPKNYGCHGPIHSMNAALANMLKKSVPRVSCGYHGCGSSGAGYKESTGCGSRGCG